MITIGLLAIVATTAIYRVLRYLKRLDSFCSNFTYPSGDKFFGVFPEFVRAARESKVSNSISEKLIEWRMKHIEADDKKCWIMKITPFHRILNVGCPKMANFLLNLDPACAVKGGFSEFLLSTDPKGFLNGLILMEASQWKEHRNVMKKLFNHRNLGDYVSHMDQSAKSLVSSLLYQSNQKFVDPCQNIIRFTYEVMFKCIMGETEANCLSDWDRTHDSNIAFFDAIAYAINWKVRNMPMAIVRCVLWKFKILREFFIARNPVLKDEQMAQAARDEYVDEIITQAENREEHEFGGMAKLLMEARKKGAKVSLSNIKAHLFTFAFAGHETTSTALRWCVYYLSKFPEWQKIIRQEFEEHKTSDEITPSMIRKSSKTTAFINEVLRLVHVVDIIDTRKLTKDVVLPDGTVMPAGMQFQIDIANVHKNSETWGENATEFNPRRWLGEQSQIGAANFSFSRGRRNCIGQKFAIQEIIIVLFRLCESTFIESLGETCNQMEGVSWKPKAGTLKHRFSPLKQQNTHAWGA